MRLLGRHGNGMCAQDRGPPRTGQEELAPYIPVVDGYRPAAYQFEMHSHGTQNRFLTVSGLVLLLSLGLVGCNDLTEALPEIQGVYAYSSSSLDSPSRNRFGTLTIFDFDRRSARFEGTYQYVTAGGTSMTGQLIGAFVERERIWFRFLDERQFFHEGDFVFGNSSGQVFFLGLSYRPTSTTFSLFVR